MEPKTWDEYLEEGLKDCNCEWSCEYIGETRYQWQESHTKIHVWGECKLDLNQRTCEGKCSKYILKKPVNKKPWYKRLFKL